MSGTVLQELALAAEIDDRATVLRLSDARSGLDQRIREVAAGGHDIAGSQTFADHLVFHGLRSTFG